jgi:phosphinothricin acetyltransferase
MTTTIRPATADDAPRITDISNQGIAERGATFETEPRTVDSIRARIKESERFPLLVADDGGYVVGWAGLSSYRARACYAGIAEFSIYLDRSAR